MTNDETKSRAEALFIRKEQQAREGSKAMAEYQAARTAEAEKTERLRAARLAREAEADSERGKEQASTEQSREKPKAPEPKRG